MITRSYQSLAAGEAVAQTAIMSTSASASASRIFSAHVSLHERQAEIETLSLVDKKIIVI